MPELATDQAAAQVGVSSEDKYLSRWTTQGEQRRWTLPSTTSAQLTIGRASSVEICIDDDPQVSRGRRARTHREQWMIRDDGLSSKGTFSTADVWAVACGARS